MISSIIIHKGYFGYKEKEVLRVEEVSFQSGELYFLLGKSGIGKSTFLEGLGLMNNTALSTSEIEFKFGQDSIFLNDIQNSSNAVKSSFRKKNYSFIFQNCNLLHNFTCGQNMTMTGLLSSAPSERVTKRVKHMMQRLDLPPRIYDADVTELSGGQKQRLSFIRALTKDFTILFADEPTGNLDTYNSHNLMDVLKSQILKEDKIGFIVTHDIELALEYGTCILPFIEKDGKGLLKSSASMYRMENGNWSTSEKISIDNPLDHIKELSF